MTRPALTTLVRRAIAAPDGEAALPRGAKVLVAVSGGPDSMALLDALSRVRARADLTVVAHGVDHGLRAEAAAELDRAEALARDRGVPFDRTRLAVASGGNVQERARVARWRALVAAARRERAAVATAHQADDRAETLLIRLLRGAGTRGLAVLPPRGTAPGAPDVAVVRPILRARRADVVLHLERHGIASAADPSNVDPRYVRTRVRRDLLPLLESLDPRIVAHLAALADELVGRSSPAAPDGERWGERAWTARLPRPTQEALAAAIRTGSGEARVWLPGGWVVSLDRRARRRAP